MTASKAKKKPASRHYVALRLAEPEYKALSELAAADRRGRGQYVELLLIRHIAEQQKQNQKKRV